MDEREDFTPEEAELLVGDVPPYANWVEAILRIDSRLRSTSASVVAHKVGHSFSAKTSQGGPSLKQCGTRL